MKVIGKTDQNDRQSTPSERARDVEQVDTAGRVMAAPHGPLDLKNFRLLKIV